MSYYGLLALNLSFPNRWYKDGDLLTDPNKHQSFSEPRSGVIVLVIKNACKDDVGFYECEVSISQLSEFVCIIVAMQEFNSDGTGKNDLL